MRTRFTAITEVDAGRVLEGYCRLEKAPNVYFLALLDKV